MTTIAQQLAEIEAEFTIVSREYLKPRAEIAPTAPIAPLTIIRNDFDEYRAIKAVNWSKLKNMRDSPLHYLHGLTAPDVDSPARLLGRAGHTLTLEPEKFEREYAVYEGEGTVASLDYKAFARANQGKQIVKGKGFVGAKCMADAVRNHAVAMSLLVGAKTEQTLTWTDDATGIFCKARVDFLKNILGDFKTTNNLNERQFGALAVRMGYPEQCAHYENGFIKTFGFKPEAIKIIAVESKAPYDVGVFTLSDAVMERARSNVAKLMQRVAECTESGEWPGAYPEEKPLNTPGWWLLGGDSDDDEIIDGVEEEQDEQF